MVSKTDDIVRILHLLIDDSGHIDRPDWQDGDPIACSQ